MAFDDYKQKESVVVVYTGESKGKTSAGMGLLVRALGADWGVAFIQFIKHWEVAEDRFLAKIQPLFKEKLLFYKGGKGFYNAGELSAKGITPEEHKEAARETLEQALQAAQSGEFRLVVCDEINNALNHGLISQDDIKKLITTRAPQTSLCLTGRNFPPELLDQVDIATNMTKIKHHFDDKFLANEGIDY
jgi:cob(I)alamin adenosyltransferase